MEISECLVFPLIERGVSIKIYTLRDTYTFQKKQDDYNIEKYGTKTIYTHLKKGILCCRSSFNDTLMLLNSTLNYDELREIIRSSNKIEAEPYMSLNKNLDYKEQLKHVEYLVNKLWRLPKIKN